MNVVLSADRFVLCSTGGTLTGSNGSVGFGTLDEMFECLTLIQTNRIKHFPTILVDSAHWRPLLEWIDSGLEGHDMVRPEDRGLMVLADTPEEVCDHVHRASSKQKALAAG